MKRNIIVNNDLSNINEWVFPTLDMANVANKSSVNISHKNEFDKATTASQEYFKKEREELDRKLSEAESMKNLLNEKISIVNKIIDDLKKPLDSIDDEVQKIVLEMVKKAIKKIILKEIDINPEIIANMINSLKELIAENDGIYTVYLSETDFNKVKQDNNLDIKMLKPDPALNTGDIIIKSHHAEVCSNLDDRLNKMLDINQAEGT